MLSKVQKPKSKQDLIKALQSATIQSVTVYEGSRCKSHPIEIRSHSAEGVGHYPALASDYIS